MRDSEIVASIVAGDPEGLAVAYDRYATDLFGYCRSLLQEPDDAADAVQDTFVIAASKLSGLRDPDRLRAWLFAVARNECLHRLKSRRVAAPLQDAPEPADDSVDIGGPAERAETIALVRAAADGLNDGERDVINQLWHGLEVPEVAAVLGVSRNHVHALFSRAREQLEASVGVLLVGRAGRRDCAALDSLLGDWDGRLNARLRRRVGRHIDQCPVCSDRRRQELSPALLYNLTPGGVFALAALRLRPVPGAAAGQLGARLAAGRAGVLRLAAGSGPHGAALPAAAARSAHSFGLDGFPRPAPSGHLAFLPRPHLPVAVVGGTAVAATATVIVTAVVPHALPARDTHGGAPPAGGAASAPAAPGYVPSADPGSSTIPRALAGTTFAVRAAHGSRAGTTGGGSLAGTASAVASTGAAGGGTMPGSATGPTGAGSSGDGPGGDGPSGAGPGGDGPGGAGAGGAGPTGGGPSASPTAVQVTDTPAPVPTTGVTVTVGGASSDPATVSAGTLTVSPTLVQLLPLIGGSLTLTAVGGPVTWSVSDPASLLGELTASPSGGTLAAGGSVTVTISVSGLLSLDTQLTVEPGGQAVTVVLEAL